MMEDFIGKTFIEIMSPKSFRVNTIKELIKTPCKDFFKVCTHHYILSSNSFETKEIEWATGELKSFLGRCTNYIWLDELYKVINS